MSDNLLPPNERRQTDSDGHDILQPLYVGIITVTSTRDIQNDPGGDKAEELVDNQNGVVTRREVVQDDVAEIQKTVKSLARSEYVDCVVTTGGTGVTVDDVTPEACSRLFERDIPGFGELFRQISYEEIGHRAMASRATAGIVINTPVFCLPGSKGAVQTGMSKLILPEAPHLAGLASSHQIE
ncbi:molybdenum cofactor biosynthesis protein MoaB [Salinarchaeum sp. IM2453]|uniref:MogA/MoaB family molybdenum cofactor biosynthesis protein n=1 Tax=Salinarchaeum sp. IM2453 TaxID=2862870 RepID=UPI001C83D97D|nr:molybdenum cofactor synthesis domain-containing protein [Salinarchaeum sp. IM2453]QZA88259.1 molybdenum cofactor biosynthesis protein MoaB [Salinarchaeum sp. IM2453]